MSNINSDNNKDKLQKLNFGLDILENGQIGTYYSELFNNETNKLLYSSPVTNTISFKNKLVFISDIPNYLDTIKSNDSKEIKLKKINTYQGSFINLSKYNTIEDYLINEISTKERSEIRRRQKRLDNCIKPVYKMYYGSISKKEYDIIFNDYRQMLLRRLEQKQSYWEELDYWKDRYATTFNLINEKKACIYVIYHNDTPISIYINSVYDKIIFNEVVAYDIDYSRFNIGILIFIKIVEWAINNDFDLIDMSKGDFSYKERFRNGTYTFQNHIIYDTNNINASIKAKALILKLNIIYIVLPWLKKLKLNKLNTLYKRIKNRHVFKEFSSQPEIIIETEKLLAIDNFNNLKLINPNNDDYTCLKKPIIDFAFLNVEFIDEIMVYMDINNKEFYLKGANSFQKIVIK
ncbi:GNAT family N-acetyltransferase [Gaetbulibacter sp. M235]|uniref:GNAT family N-acetyltransferase n=1 Tax=Gaetbulibacter sp. M235 TaxID=3126510 RepID=UPI00374FB399